MSFVIDPSSISYTQIEADLRAFLQSQPDADRWKDFFESSVGTQLIKIISGLGAMLDYNIITGRREAYLPYVVNRSSAVAAAGTLGYSSYRGRNAVVELTITPNVSSLVPKYSVIGTVKNKDVVILQDTVFNAGVQKTFLAVVGDLLEETITVSNSDPTTFRFSSNNMSSDLRVMLNDVEMSSSERVLDLINEKFVVQSNVNGAVNVMYLNLDNFAVRYFTGDKLKVQYVELNNLDFVLGNIVCDIGTIVASSYSSTYKSVESIDNIKINAPLFHETQFTIRGRDDYMKVFKLLDPDIVDTNYKDISPAVVELSYVKANLDLYSNTELNQFIVQLSGYRVMGLEPPTVRHPEPVFLNLAVNIKLANNSGNPTSDVENIIAQKEKVLAEVITFDDLEKSLETLSFTKVARTTIIAEPWESKKLYVRGCHIIPTTPNGKIYEMLGVVHKSGSIMPDFVHASGTIQDDTIIWCVEPRLLCVDDGLPVWQPTTIYREGDYVVAPTMVSNGTCANANATITSIVTTGLEIGMLITGPFIPPNTLIIGKTANTLTLSNKATGAGTGIQFTFTLMKKFRACDFINTSASSTEVQQLQFNPVPTTGTFRLECASGETIDLPFNVSALALQNALNATPCFTNVIVTGSYNTAFLITFAGLDSNQDQPQLTMDGLGQNEIQCLTFDFIPTAGSFIINFNGQNTAPIPFSATPAMIKTALEALSNIAVGEVIVTGDISPSKEIDIEFTNGLGKANQPQVTVNTNTLTASVAVTVTPSTVSQGVSAFAGQNEIQTIGFNFVPTSGTFSLTYEFVTTSLLGVSTTASTLQAALEALSSIGVGNVSVTGDFANGFVVEFIGALANSDRSIIDVATNTLIVNNLVTITPTTTQEGGGGFNEVQKIDFNFQPTAGQWQLQWGTTDYKTPVMNTSTTAAALQSYLESISLVRTGDLDYVSITVNGDTLITSPVINNIVTTGIVPGMAITGAGIPSGTTVVSTTANTVLMSQNATATANGVNINFLDASYVVVNILTYDIAVGAGVSGPGIPPGTTVVSKTPSAITLSNRVTAPGIGVSLTFTKNNVGNILVSGDFINGFLINFQGALVNTNVDPFVVSLNTLTTPDTAIISVTTTQNGGAPVAPANETQNIKFNKIPDSGTYVLNFNGQNTAPINYNDTSTAVKNALEALPNIGVGNIVVGATVDGFNITFVNAMGGANQPQLTVTSSTLNASSAPVVVTPCTLVDGKPKANNTDGIPNISTINDGVNPEPNWFGGAPIC